ncbi:Oxidoreductase, molybdopterin-binding domain-containing protein [Aspergillus pseudotamarii]|uniref:Oxidoreductase, molybdopterin-binding domain-containing protein n=1 Tax=Aspergillus pseudotamarii TaxID=132259 RepID=A0A5N6SHV9_ASPPS|nr:Oxidoreductase, molybdopterin-binding domain-containing protein [Aspergillus pseudotamarii]KAE8132704.1 Oxidoreductase, molybdopterin-binding domain-containing protein [Aspergillus pseudotamarii]
MKNEFHKYSVQNPLNREPPVKTLVSSFFTPGDISYDRNHGPIPHLSADTHTVRIDGNVPSPLRLSIHQLQTEFSQHEVICALECAGNRRHAMRTLLKEVQGIDWGDAAVMNCKWKGPRLSDVLRRAGVTSNLNQGLYVAFSCYQVQCQEDDWFGSSVELKRCLDEDMDAILAWEMNGSPLTPNHGYPVRVVLPGVAGARWVKWLDRITVQDHESSNFYQQRDYKVLPPDAVDRVSAEPYWGRTPAMCDMPINSVVAVPEDGETVHLSELGTVEVKGYAVPHGADGPVTGVQVSADGGQTWVDAEIEGPSLVRKWCWVLWRAKVNIERGTERQILSRAFDRGGNLQQEHSQWNLRGVGYNGYGRASDLIIV